MNQKILLVTAPFTQLNTPYPATAYLKGFLNTLDYDSYQVDLGIELILQLFTKEGLSVVFENVREIEESLTENNQRILRLQEDYIHTIDPVIRFLQGKNNTLAHRIVTRNYLPEASRFESVGELDIAFGNMGILDKAKYFATLYIEDIGDLISSCIDPFFGFSRYAEKLGLSASSFDELYATLNGNESLLDDILVQLIGEKMEEYNPAVVCISIPFPGNLYATLKIGQFLKVNYPKVKIVLGGGYPNTELRNISDPRIFEFCDFISIDDGEAPLKILLEYIFKEDRSIPLKRIFTLENGVVIYKNTSKERDIPQIEVGIPDYSDLWLEDYISVIEFPNPMHRLWSDGRWNKMTLAHGCYWGKCTFCDVTLDYIGRYEPISAQILCDRIEVIIEQTGENGFHFVDEAAPPSLLRDVSLEILKRKLSVVWWTNIRFEKGFSQDLCQLMADAGCIAISAGLEVASDRLLRKIRKGVSVNHVAQVSHSFTEAGVMVHAYLMYGFPTQTDQETIDSLEMVRQLFSLGVVQSGYWHRFSLTAHSPVSKAPSRFEVEIKGPFFEGFAQNDLEFEEPNADSHGKFSKGLKKALYNFMHNNMLDSSLSEWFDFDIPKTTIDPDYISNCIINSRVNLRPNALVVWTGTLPVLVVGSEGQIISISNKSIQLDINEPEDVLWWWKSILDRLHISESSQMIYKDFIQLAKEELSISEDELTSLESWQVLRENGLIIV